jgi:hypothetical protein
MKPSLNLVFLFYYVSFVVFCLLNTSIFCSHFNNTPAKVTLVELYFDMKSESRSTTQKYHNTILAETFLRTATVYAAIQQTTAVKATKLN